MQPFPGNFISPIPATPRTLFIWGRKLDFMAMVAGMSNYPAPSSRQIRAAWRVATSRAVRRYGNPLALPGYGARLS